MPKRRAPKSRTRRAPRIDRPLACPPPGFRTVTAYLAVEGGVPALEFYARAFGAQELLRNLTPDGKLFHGRVRIGDSIVMLSDAFPGGVTSSPNRLGSTSVVLHLYAPDVDELWQRAVAAGARVLMPLADQFWGERYGQLADPFGHVWSLSKPIRMSAKDREAKRAEAIAQLASGEHPGAPR